MSSLTPDNTRFERQIAEAFAAQKAGVFARTEVDLAELLTPTSSPRQVRWHERVLVGLPVAACVAAVLGFATLWGGLSPDGGLVNSPMASYQPASGGASEFSARLVVDCMSGPGAEVSNGCIAADLDNDGDVDLHDLGAYQRGVAGLR